MPKRILAADDSQTLRQALQYTFAQESEFALTVVPQGQAVLDALGREPFDLLLLDYRLPDISGADICLRCKRTPQTSHIPVLLLIGQNTDPSQFSHTGCQGVIRKPFLTSDLLERVAELLHVSVKPLPPTLSSSPKMLERTEIAIEIDVEGASAPAAIAFPPAISPVTPFASPLPTTRSSASLSPSGADLFSVPSARPASQANLIPPPLPKTTPGSPRTPLNTGMAAQEIGFPPPTEPGKAPTLQAPTDMMIDDLPYELSVSGPGAPVVRETPAPQPAPNHLFFPVSDVVSSMAPPTTPFVPDYSQEPFSSPSQAPAFPGMATSLAPPGLHHNPGRPMPNPSYLGTPDESTLSTLSPAGGSVLGTSASPSFASSPGSFLSKPLPPPSFSSQRETKPPALQNLLSPNASPSASSASPLGGHVQSQDSMDVLIGSPVELEVSNAEQAKELLLPLEDEPQAPISPSATPHRSMKAVGDYADALRNPLLTPTGLLDSRPTPRIDHLEQTAVVPAIRRQMGQGTQLPSQLPLRSPLAALESDGPRISPVSMPTPRSKAFLQSMDIASSCPPQHCQLILGSVLPLHTVAMFLQFIDYAQSRLQSSLKNEQTTPVLVNFQTKDNTSIFTFSGSYAFLRCLMPTLLECCGHLREEERQAVAESFLAGAAEEVKTQLRRACLQARISSRPYAMALSQELPELARTAILKLESSLDDGLTVHYQGSSQAQRPSEEQAYIPAKLKLRDLLLRHFTMHSLNRFMEEEFSLPLHDMVPLNLSTQSVFFAVIHHFEQRYQLPELAEAIREKHPSFPVQPFEDFPDI